MINFFKIICKYLPKGHVLYLYLKEKWEDPQNKELRKKYDNTIKEIAAHDLISKILTQYYSSEKLQKGNLQLYTILNGNKIRKLTVCTREEWIGLQINLCSKNVTYHYIPEPIPLPLFPKDELDLVITYEKLKQTFPDEITILSEQGKKYIDNFCRRMHLFPQKTWDDTIYTLKTFSTDKKSMTLDFGIDTYYHYRFTLDILYDELVYAIQETKGNVNKIIAEKEQYLALRELILGDGDAILKYTTQPRAGGCSIFIAMYDESNDVYQILDPQTRAAGIGSEGLLGTPAGYHQPFYNRTHEVNLEYTVLKEIFEEVFRGVDLSQKKEKQNLIPCLRKSPPINWLLNNLSNPDSLSMICTGHGFDLKNGNYEFPIALVIHDPFFFNHFHQDISSNWEALKSIEKTRKLFFSSTNRKYMKQLIGCSWSDEALFSFIEGLKWLKNYSPEKVSLPEVFINR